MPTALVTQKLRSTTPVTVFASGVTSSLTSGSGQVTAAAVANETNGDQTAAFEFVGTFSVAPTAGNPVDLFLVQTVDGTTYEDGSGSVFPSAPVWSFGVRAVTTAQRIVSPPLLLPPRDYLVILRNSAGQTLGAGWTLRALPVSDQSNW